MQWGGLAQTSDPEVCASLPTTCATPKHYARKIGDFQVGRWEASNFGIPTKESV